MVPVSSGLCTHTARYNYGFSKSKAKHYVRAAFLSLAQSLLQLYLGPVDFNLFVFKTHLQGRQAALSVSYRVRSENTLKTSKNPLGLYYSTCVRAAISATEELMGCVAPRSSAQRWVSALHHLRVAQAILTCTQSGQGARAFCALQPGLGGSTVLKCQIQGGSL